ncbi:MAG: ABC transporter ATP-binding protein [Bryobacteraceae bacterium]|jgi:multiple sugar transport system ATP-binding protein
MATVELKNVCKRFGGLEIIHGIDLAIGHREFVAFVGPSGSGKSTLLRLIAGLEELSGGEIFIDGKPSGAVPPAKRGLAMVFQNYALYPHMTVAENMTFSLKLAGVPAAERERKAREVARLLEMEALLDRKPRALSGGQLQRVAIGRAMVRQPKAFLLDEPLSNLDAALQAQMRLELVRLHRELQTTMIYVTHDQVEAMTMAGRIVVLNEGRIEQAGSPMELYSNPASQFVAGFIGAPKINFLEARATGGDSGGLLLTLSNGARLEVAARANGPAPGATVKLGIRPEHAYLAADGELKGEVEAVERLGPRAYVYSRLPGGDTFVVQADAACPLREGEQAGFRLNGAEAHLFDASGRVLPLRIPRR